MKKNIVRNQMKTTIAINDAIYVLIIALFLGERFIFSLLLVYVACIFLNEFIIILDDAIFNAITANIINEIAWLDFVDLNMSFTTMIE
jgi:hypothetical protein